MSSCWRYVATHNKSYLRCRSPSESQTGENGFIRFFPSFPCSCLRWRAPQSLWQASWWHRLSPGPNPRSSRPKVGVICYFGPEGCQREKSLPSCRSCAHVCPMFVQWMRGPTSSCYSKYNGFSHFCADMALMVEMKKPTPTATSSVRPSIAPSATASPPPTHRLRRTAKGGLIVDVVFAETAFPNGIPPGIPAYLDTSVEKDLNDVIKSISCQKKLVEDCPTSSSIQDYAIEIKEFKVEFICLA